MRALIPSSALVAALLVMASVAQAQASQAATPAPAPPAPSEASPTRGQLLYATHCIACHRAQVHWRDQRLVRDWAGLVEQVRAWQARVRLQWGEDDIAEVARHLNDSIYRLPRPAEPRARAPALRPPAA